MVAILKAGGTYVQTVQGGVLVRSEKEIFARAFGLPVGQMRYFGELTAAQQSRVNDLFSLYRASEYIYAIKRDGGLVWRREKLAEAWRF